VASETDICSYAGQIYLNVPYDVDDYDYKRVQTFLEHPDGSMRFDGVKFWIVSLQVAMKNAHHDEPGYWERWANRF
jgi:hypothetical protein